MMVFLINVSCFISLVLLMFFRTDFWLEYTKIFRLNFLSFYKDYEEKRKKDATLTYHLYLRLYHNCFFVRLITCPICLSIWIGILFGFISHLVFIPIFVIGGLLLFTIIDKLLG